MLVLLLFILSISSGNALSHTFAGDFNSSLILSPQIACLKSNHLATSDSSSVLVTVDDNGNVIASLSHLDAIPVNENRSEGVSYALVLDGSGDWVGFVEDFALRIQALGYDIIIVRLEGDLTKAGFNALKVWRVQTCPVPVYFYGSDDDSSILPADSIQIGDRKIEETQFIKGPVFIVCYTFPALFFAALQFVAAVRKLYKTQFPKKINPGTLVCLMAIVLSFLLSKRIANLLF
jgi:hypothetical protein